MLKPFGGERLYVALDRVRSTLGEPSPSPAMDRLHEVFGHAPMTRLFVRSGRSIVPIAVSDVSRFDADGDYVTAHTKRGRFLVHVALSRLERRLDASKFVRVHRAHVVNLDRVVSFKADERGQLFAHFADGTRVPVSRTRAQQIRSQVSGLRSQS